MEIYHGSQKIIESPAFGKGKLYNDYGRGFYCTESPEMAKEWAVTAKRSGFANCYELDDAGLETLDLGAPEYNGLHWLTVLLKHRTFDLDSPLAAEAKEYLTAKFSIHEERYDVIRGYRADDSYFSFAQDFLNGTISYRQLTNAMQLGKLGEQIVLMSEAAFGRISFAGYEIADRDRYYQQKMQRDRQARQRYFDIERNRRRADDFYIIHLLSGEVTPDDPRL